jgi:hypothetical protein
MLTESPSASASIQTEGIGWTAVSLPLEWDDPYPGGSLDVPHLADVVATNRGFVAVGKDARGGQVWTSTDGVRWDRLPDGPEWDGAEITRVISWNDRFVAAGSDGGQRAAFWVSGDGRAWVRAPDSPELAFYVGSSNGYIGGGVTALYTDGATVVAGGTPGCDCGEAGSGILVTWRSPDGLHWTRHQEVPGQLPTPSGPAVAGGAGQLRISGYTDQNGDFGASLETSSDGADWRVVYRAGPSTFLNRLVPVAGGFLAIGADQGTQGWSALAVSSTDGLTWTRSTGADLVNGSMAAAAQSQGVLVAVGDRVGQPVVWVSPPLAQAPAPAERPTSPPGGMNVVVGTWRDDSKAPAPLRDAIAVPLADGRIAVLGGVGQDENPLVTARLFDPRHESWTKMANLPEAIQDVWAVGLRDESVLLFGTSIFAWTPVTGRWTRRHAASHGGRPTAAPNGLVYVLDAPDPSASERIDVYDPARDRWLDEISLPPWTSSMSMQVVALDGKLYGITRFRVWIYSLAQHEWTAGPGLLRAGYDVAASLGLPDGRLVLLRPDVLGPKCDIDHVQLTVEVLDPSGTRWADGPALPSRVAFAAAASVSGTIYLVGGADRTIVPDCGWSVTDALDRVQSLTLAPAQP